MAMETAQPGQVRARWRADRAWRTLSLIPFGEALVLSLFPKEYLAPLFSKPPDWLGIPFGLVLEVVILVWAALGARVIWTTRSPVIASIALLTTTGPAVPLLLLSPAIVTLMQTMSV